MGHDARLSLQPHGAGHLHDPRRDRARRARLSVEVDDVDAVYAAVRASGAEIVHPLQDEEWGVRRFFVRDPNGQVVNVLGHR
ncbi:VOC family protein [Streptomyces sp. NPDC047525]|uniref:VOC family protein n=1 Tax=Streptomyces sp. NPDC047525 TaxID=3155264 RepID=UPI0033EF7223